MSTATQAETRTSGFDLGAFVKKYAIIGILLLFIVALALLTGGNFLQPQNLVNVIRQVSAIGIIAVGMTFVIIAKGIDLSVGSILGLSAVVSASLVQMPGASNSLFPNLSLPPIAGVAAGLAVGAALGLINGSLIAGFKIAPFIATLGMMTAARGLALIYTGGRPLSKLNPAFNWIGQGDIFGLPVPIIILAVVAVAGHLMLTRTRFGRHVFAYGGNEQAARVSGINISRIMLGIFTMIGMLAGLAGIILAARIGSGNPQLGIGIELDVITAAVIGGTSFNGGLGTIWGTIVGALIIGIINNGLDLMNVSPFLQQVVKGVIIVAAIVIDERKNR